MRIALVGAGGMGTCHHMNYRHIEGAQVVALVGRGARDGRARGAVGLAAVYMRGRGESPGNRSICLTCAC